MKPSKLEKAMRRAECVALDSPDLETKVGAVLLSSDTGSVISEGYNGFIRGADDENLPKTRPEKYEYMCHAEENIVTNACRNGVRTDKAILVQTLSPCKRCMRLMMQAGIHEIYFKTKYRDFEDNISMKDVDVQVTEVASYYRIYLQPRKTEKQ